MAGGMSGRIGFAEQSSGETQAGACFWDDDGRAWPMSKHGRSARSCGNGR